MNRQDLLELAPHYLLMLVLSFIILGAVRRAVGDLGFWIEFAIIGVVVFSYRPLIVRLGYSPSRWE